MFTSSRFLTIPSRECRERLQAAYDNQKVICKGERNRAAVIAIQGALSDLNRGYLLSAEVDGYFGSRTYDAVEAFQRDYGLAADGQVGRQTLIELDNLYSSDIIRAPVGLSVHIGVDYVNADHYGSDFPLQSCVNDAQTMQGIANAIGYDSLLLTNKEATTQNFTIFMRNAIENLYSGDSLFVTFSGHGSQTPAGFESSESDGYDETLCFYDRMLIDDEFYALLGQFREGVRVHLVFDSCHSGSVAKMVSVSEADAQKKVFKEKTLNSIKELSVEKQSKLSPEEIDLLPISKAGIDAAIEGNKPEMRKAAKAVTDVNNEIAKLFTELDYSRKTGEAKNISEFSSIYTKNQPLYDAIKNVVGSKEDQQLECLVVSLSACDDHQTTLAGSSLSLFTYNLTQAWQSGGFHGSYRDFNRMLKEATSDDFITPQINTYSGGRALTRLYERPFYI